MKILVFGNPLVKEDSVPLRLVPKLAEKFPDIVFRELDAVEDIQKEGRNLFILDAVEGIEKSCLIDLDSLKLDKIYSMHDFDLGYNLMLLKKINLIDKVTILAVPVGIDEKKALDQVQLILRKCVAQLMHGS